VDTALQNALNARDTLKLQIKKLQEELSKAEAFIALHSHFAGSVPPQIPPGTPLPGPGRATMTVGLQKIRIVDVAATVLSERSPLKTQEILDALDALNYRVGGEDRLVNLSSMLSRDPRFKTKRGEGWSLVAPETAMPSPVGAELGI